MSSPFSIRERARKDFRKANGKWPTDAELDAYIEARHLPALKTNTDATPLRLVGQAPRRNAVHEWRNTAQDHDSNDPEAPIYWVRLGKAVQDTNAPGSWPQAAAFYLQALVKATKGWLTHEELLGIGGSITELSEMASGRNSRKMQRAERFDGDGNRVPVKSHHISRRLWDAIAITVVAADCDYRLTANRPSLERSLRTVLSEIQSLMKDKFGGRTIADCLPSAGDGVQKKPLREGENKENADFAGVVSRFVEKYEPNLRKGEAPKATCRLYLEECEYVRLHAADRPNTKAAFIRIAAERFSAAADDDDERIKTRKTPKKKKRAKALPKG